MQVTFVVSSSLYTQLFVVIYHAFTYFLPLFGYYTIIIRCLGPCTFSSMRNLFYFMVMKVRLHYVEERCPRLTQFLIRKAKYVVTSYVSRCYFFTLFSFIIIVFSEFNVWYLDDATLGDSTERVYDDLVVLLERLRAIGLEVNGSKCELTILNDSMPEATEALFRGLLPGVRVVEACDLSLLGAPVDIRGIPGTINEKREALERMTSKLEVLNPHQAFVLLKNAFAIPKLQYVLRASPAYLCREELQIFDRALLVL